MEHENKSIPPDKRAARKAKSRRPPGSSPGIEMIEGLDCPPDSGAIQIRCADYSSEKVEWREIPDLVSFMKESRPTGSIRWLNVDGLNPWVVNVLRQHLGIHTLAAEDVLHVPQRPKLETYDGHLFLVARMLRLKEEQLRQEQVSFFLFKDLVLTVQEKPGDVWDPIRKRLEKTGSRLRTSDASYLLYALLDAVVDHCFPILETYGDKLEALEQEMLEQPTPAVQQRLHHIKRELATLRRVIWPLREVMSELQRDETEEISSPVKKYMRDVYDHAVQVMDIVETYREMAAGLNDLYMSAVGNRMNEIMKVLTIMASFFIPITFVAGVYGMNFENIPELKWQYSYAMFWGICVSIVGALLYYFYRKGWLGKK